jgi:[protein-PII] uridylyltransferase
MQQLFLQILQQPIGVDKALQEMNRLGILGAYIPAFGRISGQMQHDLFHVYTVDEHILKVVANLHRFSLPEFNHEFPLCSALFKQFDAPYLLYLAALFHDIAKGRGGDHSQLGEVDARRFCHAHGLNKADSQLVAWLVKAHLVMSSTAQKSDLSDPLVIQQFAQQVKHPRYLVALYLLTVADIRGTSPKVWNSWKAKLLETLFLSTRALLEGKQASQANEIQIRQAEAQQKLGYYGIQQQSYQAHWQQFGEQYFLRYSSTDIAWHTRLLLPHLNSSSPIVRARLSPQGDGIQVMIYQADRDNLFAQICQSLEQLGFSILEAKIYTTQHDYALDTFFVMEQQDKSINYRDLLSYIEYELSQRLTQNLAPQPVSAGRLSRQVKHMPIAPNIQLQQQAQSNKIALDIVAGDRPGLLSSVAYVLYQHHFRILNAKINTLGARAEDSFLIVASPSNQPDQIASEALKTALLAELA